MAQNINPKGNYFLIGVGIGSLMGVLFAPKSGPETRDLLRAKADEGKEFLKRRTTEVRDQTADAIERGRTAVYKQRDNLTAAVEAGKQAYREAVNTPMNDVEG